MALAMLAQLPVSARHAIIEFAWGRRCWICDERKGLLCCIDNRDYEMRCVECVAGMLPDDDKSGAYGAGKLTKRL